MQQAGKTFEPQWTTLFPHWIGQKLPAKLTCLDSSQTTANSRQPDKVLNVPSSIPTPRCTHETHDDGMADVGGAKFIRMVKYEFMMIRFCSNYLSKCGPACIRKQHMMKCYVLPNEPPRTLVGQAGALYSFYWWGFAGGPCLKKDLWMNKSSSSIEPEYVICCVWASAWKRNSAQEHRRAGWWLGGVCVVFVLK